MSADKKMETRFAKCRARHVRATLIAFALFCSAGADIASAASAFALQNVLFYSSFASQEKAQLETHLAVINKGYGANRPEFEGSAHFLAYWYNTLHLKNHASALDILQKAADVWPDEDEILWMMARTYGVHLGNAEKAAECRKKAEEMFERKAPDYRKASRYHFELALRYLVIDEPRKALDECWESINSGEEQKRNLAGIPGWHWSTSLMNSAYWEGSMIATYQLRQPRAAAEILSKAFEVWPDSSEVHAELGSIYGWWLQDFPSAEKHLEQAVALSYSLPDYPCAYEGVPPNRKKVWITGSKKRPNWERVQQHSFNLATYYLDEAEDQAPEKTDKNVSRAMDLTTNALESVGIYLDEMSSQSEQSRKSCLAECNWRRQMYYHLLARAYGNYPSFRGHDAAKGLQYALDAVKAGEQAKSGGMWTSGSEFVGISYYNVGKAEEAIKFLTPATYFDSAAYLSYAYAELADKMLSHRSAETSRQDIVTNSSVDLKANGQINIVDSQSQAQTNDVLNKSLAAFSKTLSFMQRLRGTTETEEGRILAQGQKARRILTHGIGLNLRLNHPDAALGVIESGKARALLDLLSMTPTTSTEHLIARSEYEKKQLLAQADELRGKIETEKNVQGGTNTHSFQRSLVVVEDKAKKLAENVGNWRNEIECTRNIAALNLEEVKRLMEQSGATLVSYWNTNYVAVVSSNVFEIRPLTCPDLPRKVAAFRDATAAQSAAARGLMPEADKTQKPKADAVSPVSRDLYDALIRPVEDLIRTDLVFVSPDSSTHFLSFQALNDGTNYFGEKHAIAYAPSASVLKYCIAKRKPATGKILALGNPNLQQAEYKLVNAEKEATELAGAFPDSRALVGNEATEKAVQLLGGDYDVLHFACHGTVDLDEPMQSCLRLSPDKDNDGYLHAGEVFDMHLNASLVTLSACESGLGKVTQGSEVLGLPRAFMFAGTPSVVASLWKVDDKATAELMKAFYGNLKTMDKAEALRQAQVSMIKQGKSPFYWAAFCLYGDYK